MFLRVLRGERAGLLGPFYQIRCPGNRQVYLSPDRGGKHNQTVLIAKARVRVYVVSGARNARHFGIADELDVFAGEAIDEIHGGWTASIESLVRIGDEILPVAAVVGVPAVMGPLDLDDLLVGDVGSP